MREVQLLQHLQAVAAADPDAGGRPLADAVDGQHRGFLERRGEERARGVALMVLGEQELLLDVRAGAAGDQMLAQQALLEQLLLEPHRQRHAERAEALGRERQVGLEQALELQKRLVVEGDPIDLVEVDPPFLQAVRERVLGEGGIVLLAREPLLLGGGDELAVHQQRGRAVVVERRQAENAHPPPRAQNTV